jgi:ATP-binding cassette subfamily C protein CydD
VRSIEKVTDTYRVETMRVLRVSFLSGFALELLASISVAIVAVSIGFRLVDGSLALAVGLFVLLLAPEAYLPLRQVGVQFHAAAEGVAATDDVFAVLDEARELAAMRGARRGRPTPRRWAPAGTARAHRTARPARRPAPALRRPRRGPGTVTLIEGPSGAGKSSVFAALRGAVAFDGHAELDGTPVSALSPRRGWPGRAASGTDLRHHRRQRRAGRR